MAGCLFLAALLGCGGEARSPSSTPPASDPAPAGYADAGVDPLADPSSADAADPYDTAADQDAYGEASDQDLVDYRQEPDAADNSLAENSEPAERPDDVTQWKPEHYKSAKIERDPKLADAVKYLDEPRFRANDTVANVLANLLTLDPLPKVEEPQPSPDGYGGYGGYGGAGQGGSAPTSDGYGGGYGGYGGGYGSSGTGNAEMAQITQELAREVVAALGRNSSNTAGRELYALVRGEVDTPLDKQSMFTAALRAMASNMRPQYEQIIFRLATAPEGVIKVAEETPAQVEGAGYGGGYGGYGGGGDLTVDWVRQEMLNELRQWASVSLRQKLAEHLDDDQVTSQTAGEFEGILLDQDPRNLPAQIVLFQSRWTSDATRQQLEQRLAEGGRLALAYLMGVDAEAAGQGGYGGGYGGYGGYGGGYAGARSDSGYGGGYGSGGYGSGGIAPPVTAQAATETDGRPSRPSREPAAGGQSADGYGYGSSAYGGGYAAASAPPPQQDPAETYAQLARLLWTQAAANAVASRVLAAPRLEDQTDLVRILATMPTAAARDTLQQLFDKFQSEGPTSFTTAGLLGQNLMDPAFVLTAKKAYHGRTARRDEPRGRGRANASDAYGGAGAYGTAGYGGAAAYGGGQGSAANDPWEREVENYVRFLSDMLAQAKSPWGDDEELPSAAAEDAGTGSSNDPDNQTGPRRNMPVPLHPRAQVTTEYHLRWPHHAAARLPGAKVAPLEIHYVRIEEENRPNRLSTFYKRHAGRNAITRESDGGGWFDGLIEDAQTGERRSVDIRIYNDPQTAGVVNTELRPNDQRPIVVEILTISVPPASAADTTAVTVSELTEVDADLPF